MLIRFAKRFFKKKAICLFYFRGSTIFSPGDGWRQIRKEQVAHMASTRRYRIDGERGRLVLGRFELPFPRSRTGRVVAGSLFVAGGVLGFLPFLGFWMVPLGLIILSNDLPAVRRRRRKAEIWWRKRYPQVRRAGK